MFNHALYVPYNDVQYLGNNAAFNDVEINPDTLPKRRVADLKPDRHQPVESALRLPGWLYGSLGGVRECRRPTSRF